jgi:tetratricopeptide (TPR) repeat protein
MQDCELAIQCNPYYEKSWIRKWRALTALGMFQTVLECLENGSNSIPESSKIKKELSKAVANMDLEKRAQDLLQKRFYQSGASATDNIALLHLAARADAYTGYMDASLEKVNRALRYNPNQPACGTIPISRLAVQSQSAGWFGHTRMYHVLGGRNGKGIAIVARCLRLR